MTPQKRLVVMIDIITIKAIEFQNVVKPGADGYGLLEVGCRNDWIFPRKVDTVKRKVSASVFHT
jgi:hypothetical protein